MLKTLRGFKDFILRGNVVDLSVGIVIGAAFTALVSSFTNSFIEPLLQLFGAKEAPKAEAADAADGAAEAAAGAPAENVIGGKFTINGVDFPWSTFVNGVITFLITAAVLYFLVVTPMNKLAERRKKGVEPEPEATSEEILLLREIRDSLKGGNAIPTARQG